MALDMVDVLAAIRARIEAALPGVQVYDQLQANPAAPCLLVGLPNTVDPHWTMGVMGGGAKTRMEVPVLAIVSMTDRATAFERLAAFLSPASATGVPAVIEEPPGTLGDERVASVLVTEISEFGEYQYGSASYLGGVMTVEVTG